MQNAALWRHVGFFLNVVALALFFPGIFMPMFSLEMSMSAGLGSSASMTTELINQELSIMQTVEQLWSENRLLVAVLIFVFSVCIPLLKSSLVTYAYFAKRQLLRAKIIGFVGAIGKWSMADVFVVAIFLAVLSTNHADTATQQNINMLGFKFVLDISSSTLSNIGIGFYFFVAYCLLSLAGTQCLGRSVRLANERS